MRSQTPMISTEKISYVYILAASHSGSTLLAMLLNAHPDVVTIGELMSGGIPDVTRYRCSCHALLHQCPFWKHVTERMLRHHSDFNLNRWGTRFEATSGRLTQRVLRAEHRGRLLEAARDTFLRLSPVWQRQFPEIVHHCRDFVSAVLETTRARVFVDSSKVAQQLKFLKRVESFDIKVVHLVRDGRAVALTYMEPDRFADAQDPTLRRGGAAEAVTANGRRMSMTRAADEWRRCLRSAECVLNGIEPSKQLKVHYEELCADPVLTLGQVFRFLGVDPENAPNDFRSIEHHVIGNGMRLDASNDIRLDERWKKELTPIDLSTFDAISGSLMKRYGYHA